MPQFKRVLKPISNQLNRLRIIFRQKIKETMTFEKILGDIQDYMKSFIDKF